MRRNSAYPEAGVSAQVFWQEGLRHLTDAHFLLEGERFPASIASAHKAQELVLKAALILDNTLGFWDKMFRTHKPLTEVSSDPLLSLLNTELNTMRPGLASAIKLFETLEPTARFTRNAEYPFYTLAASGDANVWVSPEAAFTQDETKAFYLLAREVALAVQTLYVPLFDDGIVPPVLP